MKAKFFIMLRIKLHSTRLKAFSMLTFTSIKPSSFAIFFKVYNNLCELEWNYPRWFFLGIKAYWFGPIILEDGFDVIGEDLDD
jgi:hypothetical protein